MADDQDKSSKTEDPTDKKLRDARRKGDVPSSRETGSMMVVFSLFVVAVFVLPTAAPKIALILRHAMQNAVLVDIGSGQQGVADVVGHMRLMSGQLANTLAPLFLAMVLAALFGVLIQGETVIAAERIKPKLSKISPLGGLKRLFSANTVIEFLKSLTKVLVIGVIAYTAMQRSVTEIWTGIGFQPEAIPGHALRAASFMLIGATIFLVPIAIADIIWKRAQWTKKLRMSLKEIQDEHKDSEGDPRLKSKRMEIARRRSRQRMTMTVPTATVILTNPTHFAVALKYVQGVDAAPICVAKGVDAMALKIREIAQDHDVPIIENKPLARALHAVVDIEGTVPAEHWQAVAEIVGYIMDLQRNIKRKPPEGSSLHLDS